MFRVTLLIGVLGMSFPVFAADGGPKDFSFENDATVVAPVRIVAEAPIAKAQTEQGMNWWQLLLGHLMTLVFSILGMVATVFVGVLLKKYGFQTQTEKINDILTRAVGFAEQKSKQVAKLDGKPLEGAKKLELAINFALELAKDYKIREKGRSWWEDKVESWLGVTG